MYLFIYLFQKIHISIKKKQKSETNIPVLNLIQNDQLLEYFN